MTDFIKKIKNALADWLFTVKCPYCGRVIHRHENFCKDCQNKFPSPSIVRYAVGGYRCASPFPYDGIFKNAVSRFKFNNCGAFAHRLAFMIAQSVREVFPDEQFDFVTCVPMHKKSFKERGYNQAELLAKECAKFLSLPYVDTLEKFKENKTQHSVSGKERAQNVRGVYRIIEKDRVAGKKILIIDDIITTGNTLGECARIISKAKCTKICCATLCAVTHN